MTRYQPSARLRSGGWWRLDCPPGWEGFTVEVRVDVVSGSARLVGLRLEPLPGQPFSALDAERLRHLPVGRFVAEVDALRSGGLERWAETVVTRERPPQGRKRMSTAHLRSVLREVQAAKRAGRPQAKSVGARWGIPPRTAERWIREARERLGEEAP